MRKYRITTVTDPVTTTVTFINNDLVMVEVPAEMEPVRKSRFLSVVPVTFEEFKAWMQNKNFVVQEVPQDLSFEAFWLRYNYKVGKKERAKKLWQSMTDDEHAAALLSIKKYNAYLINHPTIERAYPETWLSQRRWENSF
ncbi:MAG: hypothetical protein PHQ65_12005 [Bacteroidales bacterium]|nr:hypothetical protein [Bacteroidales bacterium]MDD3665981.1 hypothetical protein [Bacteroidales bacterium]